MDPTKRKSNTARVSREVVKRETLFTRNIYGKSTIKTAQCRTCNKFLNVTSFYMEAKCKRKRDSQGDDAFSDHIRTQCIQCYDAAERNNEHSEYKRSFITNKTKNKGRPKANTIIEFFK